MNKKFSEKQIIDKAVGKEDFVYPRKLTQEEIVVQEHTLIEKRMEFLVEQEKFEVLRGEFNQKKKLFLAYEARVLAIINSGEENIREEVFHVPDFTHGVMQYVNTSGEIVHVRPLDPAEKQMNIFPEEEEVEIGEELPEDL